MKLALTGPPGSGKTTLCGRLVESLELTFGGILTQEIRNSDGRRTGFRIWDIATGAEGTLASTDRGQGPSVGPYRVHLDDLERMAIPAIERALVGADVVIIDEVAPMELKSNAFVDVTERVLSSDGPVLVTFKSRQDHPLIRRIRDDCECYEITADSRETVFTTLRERLASLA